MILQRSWPTTTLSWNVVKSLPKGQVARCNQKGFVSWFLFEFSHEQEPQKNWDSCTALYLLHGVGRNCSWKIDAKLNRKCRIGIYLRPQVLKRSTFFLGSNCHIAHKSLVSEQEYFYSVKKHLLKNAKQDPGI